MINFSSISLYCKLLSFCYPRENWRDEGSQRHHSRSMLLCLQTQPQPSTVLMQSSIIVLAFKANDRFFMKHFFYVCPSTRLFVNIYFLPTGWAIISFSFCIEKRNIAMPQLFHMSMLVLHPSAKKFSDGLKLKSCLNLMKKI